MGKRPAKKRKVELVFDEKKRREYLSGFRKRKQERRKKARDDLELQVKEERKRLKLEAREDLKNKFKLSFAPIPELADELNEEEFETEDVKVKIVEISTSELAKSNNWIGENRPKYSDDEDDDGDEADGTALTEQIDGIPGMDLTVQPKSSKKPKAKESEDTEKHSVIDEQSFKSKKNLTGTVHNKAVKALKSSKAFQIKRKLDQLKDRKKSRLEREKRKKIHDREARKHNGKVSARKIKKKSKVKGGRR
ncbi:ribosomal RNA-processing protein 17 [Bradysia coprophila]|uniref:ribosomal RNA-processing protein 17 n=1 Tax=Bradysia coprophila TaxID=38358 RepID=UPI00187D8170|nr:ribosomal RNA-processing protein 17 [Bradysia coprophila]